MTNRHWRHSLVTLGISLFALIGWTIVSMPTARTAYAQADPYARADEAYKNKDYSTAHQLWLVFAEIGNRTAYFNLGRMYVFGHGVAIDLIEAYKWFKLADHAGLAQAKSGLARVSKVMTRADFI
jgi:TPR repeat protein